MMELSSAKNSLLAEVAIVVRGFGRGVTTFVLASELLKLD